MNCKLNGSAYEIVIDEPASRFFIIGGSVWVYDLTTNEKIVRLKDIGYPTYVYVSHRHNLVLVQSTDGRFAFYTADRLAFLGKLKIRGAQNTDEDFYYDEEENAVYGIYTCNGRGGGVGHGLAEIRPDTMQYSALLLPQLGLDCKEKGGAPYTRYSFIKHTRGGYYMIRNSSYHAGASAEGAPHGCESCYGRFEKVGNDFVLKETLFEATEGSLEKTDITEGADAPKLAAFRKALYGQEYLVCTRRNERGLFAITNEAVYRLLPDGACEEVCREQYMSDYAEYGGRRYICTWKHCLIQEME